MDGNLSKIGMSLRDVRESDNQTLFHWRNMDEIVALGASKRRVTLEEHLKWFERVLLGNDIFLFIIEEEEKPVGQVRFEMIDRYGASISIYLIPGHTGKKRGVVLIQEACRKVISNWMQLEWVQAVINIENKRSIRAFKNVGFVQYEEGSGYENFLTLRLFVKSWRN